MTVRVTSDVHIGHRKVAEIRGFASVDEHDDHPAADWRAGLRPGDQAGVHGDVVVSMLNRALSVLADLSGGFGTGVGT
ncbi:hypothetical protein [Amycolatopsis alba]|uniref:Uncharacterized protein n=1 Tax=Amycolatopsis alba DSM 44262 TaxID=1125972 RepID=A0A229RAW3_AMYAL|nr:hypothetical protein [Amycolatopsis alba]OXM43786.1 hypothetical protein CFP75_37055 [Amycolatopsis alba DSM 44262]